MLFSILLILVIMNADAFCTGFIYGMQGIKIPILSKLLMSACSIFYCYISIICGKWLSEVLPFFYTKVIGFLLLLLLGVFMVIKGMKAGNEKYDFDHSKKIEPLEAICLGLALSADCLSVGMGLAMLGISSYFLPVLMGLFQLVFISAGDYLSKNIFKNMKLNEKFISILAGVLLIFLAFTRMFF